MRRVVIVVPELLSLDDPILDRSLPNLRALAERSDLFRLSQLEAVETPEARFLGLRPSDAELRQGPLTIAALGADPPQRSLHFHVSLLGLAEDLAIAPAGVPTAEDLRTIVEAARKLDTRLLTFVAGSGLDHGLVWEALGDLGTTSANEVVGKPIWAHLPEGDGQPMLRQYIDDSVNLLSGMEFNHRRIGEGTAPLNLLWPWGHGVRVPVPNLALRRASPALVMSNSLRLSGLSRLCGYRHIEVGWLGLGLQTRLKAAMERLLSEPNVILVLDTLEAFRAKSELDEAAYFARQLDSELFGPILEGGAKEHTAATILAPSTFGLGLGLKFDSRKHMNSIYPFDERSTEEKALSIQDLESAVDAALRPEDI